jgi:hypothetical protein
MKAVTINISLNSDLADFARADSEAGAALPRCVFRGSSENSRQLA